MDLNLEFSAGYHHRVLMARGLLRGAGRPPLMAGDDGPARACLVLDKGLATARPGFVEEVTGGLPELDWQRPPYLVPGGEPAKNDPSVLEDLLRHLHDAHLCRRSYVVAAGGGAVLDLVGLAAALTHRGVRLIRLSTTTLGQADSAVGVKNGVNRFGKKNFLGTFAPPWAVLCDPDWLTSLRDYDWRSGFSEAVKVALLKDPDLFETLDGQADALRERDLDRATPVLARSAELHTLHIVRGGDPFEWRTARPLDFGHWAAHKLEQMSGFRLGHGHAVAIGLAIDVTYSALAGLLSASQAERICGCLERLGFVLPHPLLSEPNPLLDGLEEFREHLGGPLTITLLRAPGEGFDATDIDPARMQDAIRQVAARASSACP